MKLISFLCLSSLFFLSAPADPSQDRILNRDNQKIQTASEKIEKFYELGENESWRDITEQVLSSSNTPPKNKEIIRSNQRRIIVFKYPSDGLWIKGFISFTPSPTFHPLLILYRGGNDNFGLINPGTSFAIYDHYTVISSTLRGGVSQGEDEFGGKDVDDIKNLMDYLPRLAQLLGIELHPHCVFMLGLSRGGLEMFLTLARFPELQNRVNKVVALSSILDLHRLIQDRPNDMKQMLENRYGLQEGAKGDKWIAKRDPLNTVPFLKKNLPILIIQGTADQRVSLAEGYHMTDALRKDHHDVNYWEVQKGDHTLMNTPYIMHDIARWLESNSSCVSVHYK